MNADNSQPDGIEYGPDGDEIMTSEDNQNPITGTIDNSANGGANTDDTSSQPSGLQTSENSEPPFPRRPLTIPIGQASRFRFGSVDPSMLSDSDAQDSEPQHQQLLITQLRAEINALKGQLDGSLTAAQRSAVEHRDTLLRNAVSDKQELQKQLDTHKGKIPLDKPPAFTGIEDELNVREWIDGKPPAYEQVASLLVGSHGLVLSSEGC